MSFLGSIASRHAENVSPWPPALASLKQMVGPAGRLEWCSRGREAEMGCTVSVCQFPSSQKAKPQQASPSGLNTRQIAQNMLPSSPEAYRDIQSCFETWYPAFFNRMKEPNSREPLNLESQCQSSPFLRQMQMSRRSQFCGENLYFCCIYFFIQPVISSYLGQNTWATAQRDFNSV